MAQRLVRTICPHCKTEQKVERSYLKKIGFPAHEIDTARFWRGAGCEDCRQLGYQGRMGIYELLLLNEAIRPLILNRSPASTITAPFFFAQPWSGDIRIGEACSKRAAPAIAPNVTGV